MIKGQREGEGEGGGQQEGGGGDEKAVFKGFVTASTGLRLLRVYCKSRPHATEGKGGEDREQATNQKQFPSQTERPLTTGFQPIEKTTGQRRFWKIGSVGITKLHISSVQTGLGISFARVTVVSKLFGGKNNPPRGELFHLLLVYHSIFLSFFFGTAFFTPPSPLRYQSLSGWEPNHALSSCGLHAFQVECSRWKPFFPPLG